MTSVMVRLQFKVSSSAWGGEAPMWQQSSLLLSDEWKFPARSSGATLNRAVMMKFTWGWLAALDVLLLRFALLTVFYRARAAGENFCKQRIWSDVLGAIPGPKERVPGGLLCWWPLFPFAFCSKVHI